VFDQLVDKALLISGRDAEDNARFSKATQNKFTQNVSRTRGNLEYGYIHSLVRKHLRYEYTLKEAVCLICSVAKKVHHIGLIEGDLRWGIFSICTGILGPSNGCTQVPNTTWIRADAIALVIELTCTPAGNTCTSRLILFLNVNGLEEDFMRGTIISLFVASRPTTS
jgi:hypothetical protein